MMSRPAPTTIAEMYDYSVLLSHRKRLPPDLPRPHLTEDWPPENILLLEQYCQWLQAGGTSQLTIRILHIPMAGHVLGLTLKPHSQLDLDADIQRALEYVLAKQLSAAWTKNCRNALHHFKRFLRLQRGLGDIFRAAPALIDYSTGLPGWLAEELERYLVVKQRNWRPARLNQSIRGFWSDHRVIWGFFAEQCQVQELSDLRRKHLFDYIDFRLKAGKAVSGINTDMRNLHSFLLFLQEQGYSVPQSLLRLPGLTPPDPLPRFLTDTQVRLLRDEIEQMVQQALRSNHRRDTLLTRAAFYLLWQSGMRLGEVEELRLEDVDLPGRKLVVRQSKKLKDRTVYLTDISASALQEYLAVRGEGSSDHVFLYRNRALCKDLLRPRIQAAGQAVGIKVFPHRLRHTCATQLLNAGCRVTSIQKFLGHRELSTTMIYAHAHDQTVAEDYYTAMSRVEQRLQVGPEPEPPPQSIQLSERQQLLSLAEELAAPDMSHEGRLNLVEQMRCLLMVPRTAQSVPMEASDMSAP